MQAINYDAVAAARERFWGKVVCVDSPTDTCWHWLRSKDPRGYGKIKIGGRWFGAHRVAWILTYGEIEPGLSLDHLCRNPACVNPAHLEQVTHRINMLRGTGMAGRNAAKTHCPQGHPYAGIHLRPINKDQYGVYRGRQCRTCQRERYRLARSRRSQD